MSAAAARQTACTSADALPNAYRQRKLHALSIVTPFMAQEEADPGETRVQSVIRRVVERIREGRLKVGDQLPSEVQFAQDLGVSRPVVREAFGALAALNIIEVANGRRPRVSSMNASVLAISLDHAVRTEQISVQEVWEVRRTLEAQTAALAAARRTPDEAAHIRALAEAMRDAKSGSEELVRLDIALHHAIAMASRNILLIQIIASFEPLMERAVPVAWSTRRTEEERLDVLARHLELARAIGAQDAVAAAKAMDDHFDRSITSLLEAGAAD
jgi:GntR family transcriptional regulator, transcriptional repressor for pyruvate dehydrogenase complex